MMAGKGNEAAMLFDQTMQEATVGINGYTRCMALCFQDNGKAKGAFREAAVHAARAQALQRKLDMQLLGGILLPQTRMSLVAVGGGMSGALLEAHLAAGRMLTLGKAPLALEAQARALLTHVRKEAGAVRQLTGRLMDGVSRLKADHDIQLIPGAAYDSLLALAKATANINKEKRESAQILLECIPRLLHALAEARIAALSLAAYTGA